MRKIKFVFISILAILVNACTSQEKTQLNIAAAANMQYALTELIGVYNAQNHTNHKAVFSSSGKLNAQIKQGAPFDVFVSADMRYAQDLYDEGFSTHPPQVYAYGALVMWSYNEDFDIQDSVLISDAVKHIAVANHRTAPYGRATKEYLEGKNWYTLLEPKFVYGEGIGQTNQFITSGAAEIGFTAKSVVLSDLMKDKGVWTEIDPSLYAPISQGLVILKNATQMDQAQKFVAFMQSKRGQEILLEYGYQVP